MYQIKFNSINIKNIMNKIKKMIFNQLIINNLKLTSNK